VLVEVPDPYLFVYIAIVVVIQCQKVRT